jgi:RNA polymerase sigma factor (sigma-70 family)
MTSDGELLRRYTESASEEAFGELVRRHLDLVYSAALRQVNRDAHLAQDVAQAVFTDLARKAGSLTDRAALAGWLYTSTHYAAAKAVRTERRRQTHEQEAHAMQELLRDPEPNLDWETFRPVLDAAMHELSESDREVILLRYFENRQYADIGEQIDLGENAARMKVDRALEKLRTVLSRRGVTTTVALAAALSANAVTAAPAGLAATITASAALAGSAVSTTVIATATKTIAMTMLPKTLIAVALAAAIGTGIYGTLQASRLRKQNQALQQQQSLLAGQLQELHRQHNDATNRLSALIEENLLLKSGQQLSELLKLRGQVGVLRQSLSDVAATNRPLAGISKMMNDPAMKEYIHQAQLKIAKEQYGPLVKELKLSPEETEKFTQLIGDGWLKVSEMLSTATQGDADRTQMLKEAAELHKETDDQLQSLLGEAGYARYVEFNQQIPAQTTVKLLNDQLGDNGLSDDQSARLAQIVNAQPYASTHGITGELDAAFLGSQEEIDSYLQQVAESNQRILDQAAGFLTPQQLAVLAVVQSNSVSAEKIQGAALTQKH